MNPQIQIQRQLKLPLTFITFAITEAKMYRHKKSENTFLLQHANRSLARAIAYGAVFLLNDAYYYFRILDAYSLCSMTVLLRNHRKDTHHRERSLVVPIRFSSLEELSRLQYTESGGMEVEMYYGNPEHHLISERLNKTNSYRISDGLDSKNFVRLYEEVNDANHESALHGRMD